jgi:hypothetical protein
VKRKRLNKAKRLEIERQIDNAIERANKKIKEINLISPQLADVQLILKNLKILASKNPSEAFAKPDIDFKLLEDKYKQLSTLDLTTVVEEKESERDIPEEFDTLVHELLSDALPSLPLADSDSLLAKPHELSEPEIDLKVDFQDIRFYLKSKKINYLYHVTDFRNVDSIDSKGFYSWYYCLQNNILSYNETVGDISRPLDLSYNYEDFVRLSFCNGMPMFYKNKSIPHFVYLIDPAVCEWKETLFTNMNATDNLHRNGGDIAFLKSIKLEYTQVPIFNFEKRSMESKYHQAEILVKTHIPKEFILEKRRFF